MKHFYRQISNALTDILATEYGSVTVEEPLWEIPQKPGFGDFSTMIALKIASQTKENPLVIAEHIKEQLSSRLKGLEKIEVLKPGFVNLFLSREELVGSLNQLLSEPGDYFRDERGRRVLLEFLSANPTGPLSVAHGRQAIVGDVIANVLEFCGDEVVREYYVNDAGRQIELLVESVDARRKELRGEAFVIPEGGYFGDYIKDVAKTLLDHPRESLRPAILDCLLGLIRRDLKSLGIEFDNWVSQSALIGEGKVEESLTSLVYRALAYEQDGAWWFKSTEFGDDKDRVLKKQDGEYTYFASDIAYHQNKLSRKFDKLLNLWGPDHHGYIPRVQGIMQALGASGGLLSVLIIQLVTIKSKERMSRRRGTAILLSDLVDDVGKDAARFYYISRRNSSPLDFDIDLARQISFDNPLYYVQYAHARICSIFEKAGDMKTDLAGSAALADEEEYLLLRKLFQFTYCLDKIYYSWEPVFLIEFLKTAATAFHKFYEQKKVLDEDPHIRQARLNLLRATRITLACGLKLLGITPLEKM
ncbi:MAG: arginine--tRNA ligase [Candidatus Omnitrophica bacterium]|nr:arginine--tRNA ligase [Candidatus Omnitrophota bacterium]